MIYTKPNVIKVDKYISEVNSFIPNGRVFKTHTGMGATHVELVSNRNSIIIEPLLYTCESKVNSHNKNFANNNAFFFKGSNVDELIRYLYNPLIIYKKIICVVDRFESLVKVLFENNLLDSFFVLIDEIDYVQFNASYRPKMEEIIDIIIFLIFKTMLF